MRSLTLTAALSTVAPAVAMAEEPPPGSNSTDVVVKDRWYGWQILLADIGGIAALTGGFAALASDSKSAGFPLISGGVIYCAGGPLIHLAHGRGEGVRRSLLLRGLAPLGGAALGAGIAALAFHGGGIGGDTCDKGCAVRITAAAGLGVGILVAMIVDWALAREPVQTSPQASSPAEQLWTPTVMVTPHGGSTGVVIRF